MLLLAYLGRREVPKELENDLKFVLKKSPIFLEEIVKIAQIPHHAQQQFGWYEPTKAAIQMCQCIVQAMPTDIRKGMGMKSSKVHRLLQMQANYNLVTCVVKLHSLLNDTPRAHNTLTPIWLEASCPCCMCYAQHVMKTAHSS